jgi:hypothetical protein
MTARALTVLIHVPEEASDQDVATHVWNVLRRATKDGSTDVKADGQTLEVHARTLSAAEDTFFRKTVFGAKP